MISTSFPTFLPFGGLFFAICEMWRGQSSLCSIILMVLEEKCHIKITGALMGEGLETSLVLHEGKSIL
jgi:hypothetical protein